MARYDFWMVGGKWVRARQERHVHLRFSFERAEDFTVRWWHVDDWDQTSCHGCVFEDSVTVSDERSHYCWRRTHWRLFVNGSHSQKRRTLSVDARICCKSGGFHVTRWRQHVGQEVPLRSENGNCGWRDTFDWSKAQEVHERDVHNVPWWFKLCAFDDCSVNGKTNSAGVRQVTRCDKIHQRHRHSGSFCARTKERCTVRHGILLWFRPRTWFFKAK